MATTDRNKCFQELETIRAELIFTNDENAAMKTEINRERQRARSYNSEKLSAESRLAEMNATKTKLEAMVEDTLLRIRVLEVELTKARSIVDAQKCQLDERASRIESLLSTKGELGEKLDRAISEMSEVKIKERDSSFEVRSLRQSKEELQKEVEANRNVIASQVAQMGDYLYNISI